MEIVENFETSEERLKEQEAQIVSLISEKKFADVREIIASLNAPDIADILEEVIDELGLKQGIAFFRILKKDVAADVFTEISPDEQRKIIDGITDKEIHFLISEMDFDDKIDTLEELPANVVDKILEKSSKEERKRINTYLNYPDDSAGSLMTPNYVTLKLNMTVKQALMHIKKVGMNSETVYTCYVKDSGRRLIGYVSLRTLVVSDPRLRVKTLLTSEELIYVNVYEDRENVADAFKKYGFMALPVVDNEMRLVGIITSDDILEVIEEEATEDIEKMAGIVDTKDIGSDYLDIPVFRHALNRLPWLIFLSIIYIGTSYLIGAFEHALSSVTTLVLFLPMLMGTGGNSGTQAATLIIRGLATDEIEVSDALKIFFKEFRISFIVGTILAVINFLRIVLLPPYPGVSVALVVSISMILVVMFAKLAGSMLPLLAKKIKIDPALIAGPFVSSITDTVSCFIYFVTATILLKVLGG